MKNILKNIARLARRELSNSMENEIIKTLDLRNMPPPERHVRIFEMWDNLKGGEILEITNDHEPKPLYYQFEAEHKGKFEWSYKKQGPKDWIFAIKKISDKTPKDEGSLIETETAADSTDDVPKQDGIENMEIDDLCDYIVKTHHSYVKEHNANIELFIEKIVGVHGDDHPELMEVQRLFNKLGRELIAHMQYEETVIFYQIKEIVRMKRGGKTLVLSSLESIENSVKAMKQGYDVVVDGFERIKSITNNLTLPEGACNAYRMAFSMLSEFEDDLHKHIHLENDILFPGVITLKKMCCSSSL